MGWLERLVAPQQRAGEPRGTTSLSVERLLTGSQAGVPVSVDSALTLSSVWAAVWLIAEQGGSLPINVLDREGNRKAGAWQQRLMRSPNPESSGVDVWTAVLAHLDLWGNAYLGKEKLGGRVVSLWPIPPENVTVERVRGRKIFRVVEDDGVARDYTAADVIHIRHRSLDGFIGVSTIHQHRNTIGVGLALDKFGGSTFSNRAVPLGVLSIKGRLTRKESRDNLREEWEDRFRGSGRQNRIAILDEDAHFEPISMPLADAQFVEQRKLSVQDVARIFGVPAEWIGGESGGSMTYSNVASRRADFLQLTLRSRLKRIEEALFADLDLFSNIGGLEPRFDTGEFLRGDPKTEYETLKVATGGKPVLTQDEARGLVGRSPLGGKAGELDAAPAPAPFGGAQPKSDAPADDQPTPPEEAEDQ